MQYLDQKSALPLIKFWLDVESFKSSLEQQQCQQPSQRPNGKQIDLFNDRCQSQYRHNNEINEKVKPMMRSVSLDGNMLMNRDDFCSAYNAAAGQSREKFDEMLTERDNGDGSSDANSMTNSSDICERNNDDEQIEDRSFDHCDEFYDSNRASKIDMNGRKSATGASQVDDDFTENTHSKLSMSGANPTSSVMDAIRIFKKYLLNGELTSLVHIPTNILSQISLVLCVQNEIKTDNLNDSRPGSRLSYKSNDSISMSTAHLEETNIENVFDDAQSFVLNYLDGTYTSGFLESPFYYRFCVENAGNHLKVIDFLYNETALFYFMEFLENENRRQYLDFWLTAMNFKRQVNQTIPAITKSANEEGDEYKQQNQNDALILYDKYFSLQATCSLNLSDRVRFYVEEKICPVGGSPAIENCFDVPLAIVERFLGEKYLRAFERSNLFCKYEMEMLKKLETSTKTISATMTDNELGKTHNDRKMSQKDFSISSKNTLLAMESVRKSNANRIKASTSDMCIDSRQLHNPDLLWRRNSMNGLNFGRVNALGRYERDYDMTPFNDRNSGNLITSTTGSGHDANQILQNTSNKIKRAVRKLVHLPEQCMQEELAWQMAEIIVNDITNVTLHSHEIQKQAT